MKLMREQALHDTSLHINIPSSDSLTTSPVPPAYLVFGRYWCCQVEISHDDTRCLVHQLWGIQQRLGRGFLEPEFPYVVPPQVLVPKLRLGHTDRTVF